MLLVLLYHRINKGIYSNSMNMFRSHIRFIVDNYPIVLPGDPLPCGKMAICLTFDDAYYDFYQYVFPFLRELNIKALLAVPVKYIVAETDLDSSARLKIPVEEAMKEGVYQKDVPFCTWAELKRMVESGHVEVASHSFSHADLSKPEVDLDVEVALSKALLEERLCRDVTTFVYPFGKYGREVHSAVSQRYKFSMRIGTAVNKDWHNSQGIIYRVVADNLPDPMYPLGKKKLLKYYIKYLSNTIRGR